MDDRSDVSRLIAISLGMFGTSVFAQEAPPPADDPNLGEVVVTGTRVAARTHCESLAPIDVLTSEALESQGTTELAEALATVAPSLDFPRPAITDGTDHIRLVGSYLTGII